MIAAHYRRAVMAWMIKAGNGKTGQGAGAAGLSIASHNQMGASGWRFVSTHCHYPNRHPQGTAAAAAATKSVWQDVLAQLTTEL